MANIDVDRYCMKSNIMKKVIFRVDYKGVIDIKDFVKSSLEELINPFFEDYETTFQNTFNIDLNINAMSELLSVPIKEIEKQEIHRFTGSHFTNKDQTKTTDSVVLDISKYFSTLEVTCLEYKNIDPYLDFFALLMSRMTEFTKFISIKRIGLRKLGSKVFYDFDEIFETFEKKYFYFDFSEKDLFPNKINHLDVLEKDHTSPVINYSRSFDKGTYISEDGEKDAFQITLDLDGYMEEDRLPKTEIKDPITFFSSHLKNINDNFLFKVFVMSVTDQFINANKK